MIKFTGLLVVFLKKKDKFILDKKYYKNIIAFIIGNNYVFFKKEFKNKILFFKIKNLKKAINKIIDFTFPNCRAVCLFS